MMLLVWVMNWAFVSGVPFSKWKKSPELSPLLITYAIIIITGHKTSAILPKSMAIPLPKWSHLDCFRYTWMDEGCCKESQVTSPHARWTDRSKAAAKGTVISPTQKKPKKQVTAAAHSTIVSRFDANEAY